MTNQLSESTQFMQKTWTDAILYIMCFLSIGWALVQTVLINRIPMSPDKVKVNIISKSELVIKGSDQEQLSQNLNEEIP